MATQTDDSPLYLFDADFGDSGARPHKRQHIRVSGGAGTQPRGPEGRATTAPLLRWPLSYSLRLARRCLACRGLVAPNPIFDIQTRLCANLHRCAGKETRALLDDYSVPGAQVFRRVARPAGAGRGPEEAGPPRTAASEAEGSPPRPPANKFIRIPRRLLSLRETSSSLGPLPGRRA